MRREEELLEKVREWQTKAGYETDPFNKYVSIFIAFNIFYNLYAKKLDGNLQTDFSQGDSHRAITAIRLAKPDELLKSIEPDLREYVSIIPVFREEYWPQQNSKNNVPIAQALKASFRDGEARMTIEMLTKWLYKVRCNLVHGEKSYNDASQKRLLEISSVLLDGILRHLVSQYEQVYERRA
jgi:hypothetical protein